MKRAIITLALAVGLGLFAVAMFFVTSDPMEIAAWLGENPDLKRAAGVVEIKPRAACRGVTWRVVGEKDFVLWVGPHDATNMSEGDTLCSETVPMLCMNTEVKAPEPKTKPPAPWFAGEVALHEAVAGTELTSRAVADEKCANKFGSGWRMASLSGWGFATQGELPKVERFWISSDGALANPWNP